MRKRKYIYINVQDFSAQGLQMILSSACYFSLAFRNSDITYKNKTT